MVLVSLPDEEARALRRAWKFLLGLSSGEVSLDRRRPVRDQARDIARHFPLGGVVSERTAAATIEERREDHAD